MDRNNIIKTRQSAVSTSGANRTKSTKNPSPPRALVRSAIKNDSPEIVYGIGVGDRLRLLAAETKNEVNSFINGRMLTPAEIKHAQKINSEMYERGVRSRTIYLAEVREHAFTLDHVRWLNERGSEVRTMPNLPLQMIISDRKTAVLPLDPTIQNLGMVVHRSPSVLVGLQALFEQTWAAASPLGAVLSDDGSPVSYEDRALLEMLFLGRIDREISQDIGVSERTVERRVAKLMERLNAKTRFEAGAQAVKRNWI